MAHSISRTYSIILTTVEQFLSEHQVSPVAVKPNPAHAPTVVPTSQGLTQVWLDPPLGRYMVQYALD